MRLHTISLLSQRHGIIIVPSAESICKCDVTGSLVAQSCGLLAPPPEHSNSETWIGTWFIEIRFVRYNYLVLNRCFVNCFISRIIVTCDILFMSWTYFMFFVCFINDFISTNFNMHCRLFSKIILNASVMLNNSLKIARTSSIAQIFNIMLICHSYANSSVDCIVEISEFKLFGSLFLVYSTHASNSPTKCLSHLFIFLLILDNANSCRPESPVLDNYQCCLCCFLPWLGRAVFCTCCLFTCVCLPGNGSKIYSIRDVHYCFGNTYMNKRLDVMTSQNLFLYFCCCYRLYRKKTHNVNI